MTEPKGTATITNAEMQDAHTLDDMVCLFRDKGVPIAGYINPVPHPDYTYTERVDYARHSITITWTYKGDASDLGELEL